MRIYQPNLAYCYQHRPFAGALGSALYVVYGDPDPGADAIRYRHHRVPDGVRGGAAVLGFDGTGSFGGANVQKTAAVATAKAPDFPAYALPAAAAETTLWLQLRTHKADVENESIYRPRRLVLDAALDEQTAITGSGFLISAEKRDGGGFRFRFAWDDSADGVRPAQFVLARTAGPTSPADVSIPFVAGQREYEIDVEGLTHAGAYTFTLTAKNGAAEQLLAGNNGTDILVTADNAGPAAVTVAASEY